jgi:hypothetical protein
MTQFIDHDFIPSIGGLMETFASKSSLFGSPLTPGPTSDFSSFSSISPLNVQPIVKYQILD